MPQAQSPPHSAMEAHILDLQREVRRLKAIACCVPLLCAVTLLVGAASGQQDTPKEIVAERIIARELRITTSSDRTVALLQSTNDTGHLRLFRDGSDGRVELHAGFASKAGSEPMGLTLIDTGNRPRVHLSVADRPLFRSSLTLMDPWMEDHEKYSSRVSLGITDGVPFMVSLEKTGKEVFRAPIK